MNWWFDFADRWGNTASVVGLVVALLGFPTTWYIQQRIRQKLQGAASQFLSAELEDLYRLLLRAQEASRAEGPQWLLILDRSQEAKHRILRLLGNPQLTGEETRDLRRGTDDLTELLNYLEAYKLKGNASTAFKTGHKQALARLVDLLSDIQGRLGNRLWED